MKLGASGTTQSNQVVTSCSAILNNSIAASSTGYGYCTGVTGVTSSDYVRANFATSTKGATQTAEGFIILSAFASSTSGAVDFLIANYSGKAAVPSAVGRIGSTTVLSAGH